MHRQLSPVGRAALVAAALAAFAAPASADQLFSTDASDPRITVYDTVTNETTYVTKSITIERPKESPMTLVDGDTGQVIVVTHRAVIRRTADGELVVTDLVSGKRQIAGPRNKIVKPVSTS